MASLALDRYKPPPALSWAGTASYFVRLVSDIVESGKPTKRAICLTQAVLYICDPKGDLKRAIKVQHIQSLVVQDLEIKRGIVSSKTVERHILFKVPTEGDLLVALTPDKANGPEGNDDDRFMQVLVEIGRAAGAPFVSAVTNLAPGAQKITDQVSYAKAAGHADTGKGEGLGLPDQSHTAPPLSKDITDVKTSNMADTTVVALSAKVRDLEARLASCSDVKDTSGLEAKVRGLTKQLEEEKACREDMVRDMRADFDTQFIKKQAEEFELRQRTHQRIRDKDLAKIKELEEKLAEPKVYNGDADHIQRIRKLEQQLEEKETQFDTALCKAIHYENACDEQYVEMKKYWEFISEGALPRIRDLQSGKDPKKLPLLPKMPKAPSEAPSFTYDPANKPVRKAASVPAAAPAAAAPAASGGDLDLDLDLGGGNSAKGGDLDDLDLDLGAPAAAPGIDLDDDL